MTDDEQDIIHLEETRDPIKIPKELKDIETRFWIVGTWHWLDAECNFVEKVIRWSWPFDQEAIVADLFEASVSADYSSLPTSEDILGQSEFKSISEFASSNLGLDQAEISRLDRMTLEGLENDWVFEIAKDGCISGRWLLAGMASIKNKRMAGIWPL